VALHTVNALACFGENEFLYATGALLTSKAEGMIRIVAYYKSDNVARRVTWKSRPVIIASSTIGSLQMLQWYEHAPQTGLPSESRRRFVSA